MSDFRVVRGSVYVVFCDFFIVGEDVFIGAIFRCIVDDVPVVNFVEVN